MKNKNRLGTVWIGRDEQCYLYDVDIPDKHHICSHECDRDSECWETGYAVCKEKMVKQYGEFVSEMNPTIRLANFVNNLVNLKPGDQKQYRLEEVNET